MWDLVGFGIGLAVAMGPLALSAWWSRRRAQALAIQAAVAWKVGKELGRGLFAVRVAPGLTYGGKVYVEGPGLPEELCVRARGVAGATVPEGYRVIQRRSRQDIRLPDSTSGLLWMVAAFSGRFLSILWEDGSVGQPIRGCGSRRR